MQPIQIISQDLFDKVRSRFQNLEMGDQTGAVTIDPAQARFFDFDFINEGHNLGRVSISLNELGTLKVYYSQGITENQDDPAKQGWYKFLKEMRFFAMRRLLRFDTRDISKTNLDKNDFQHLAATQAPKEQEMPDTMNESMWNHKSTKKTSRAVRGTTEVIVRHGKAVDEMYPGARSQRKNIKAIFIQNKDGERFKYPFIHPAGAFAMAQHVDHGGVPHDPAGKAIIKMSEQIAQLQEFQRKVSRSTLHDDATGITEKAVGRLQQLKAQVEALGKRHHYECWMGEFSNQESAGDDIMELDAVTMEQYKQAFTQTSFQEELAGYFPLLHKIMSEANTVDLEDYVSEEDEDDTSTDETDVKEDAFNAFEQWAEAVEQGKLTDDEIAELKQAITDTQELQLGPDGQTAFRFFSQFGLDDEDLENKFKAAAELDPKTDPLEVFQLWAQENYPEILVALGVSGTAEQPPAETPPPAEAPPAEAPPAEAPVAEMNTGKGDVYKVTMTDRHGKNGGTIRRNSEHYPLWAMLQEIIGYTRTKGQGGLAKFDLYINDKLVNWKKMVAQGLHKPDGGKEERDSDHDRLATGTNESKDIEKEMPTREGIVKEVAKIVKSFYNRDNPEVGPFRGNEGIALDCKKQVAEKFGDEAGEHAAQLAEKFMEKLTMEWQQRHGTPVNGDDGLARLKELVGNIKAKVEGIGHPEMEEKDNWHPSKHITDPQKKKELAPHNKDVERGSYADRAAYMKAGSVPDNRGPNESGPDKSQVPAYKRKEQGGDWKMSTKDLEKEKTNSPTSSAGLARKKAELGMSEELASIMRLANHKK